MKAWASGVGLWARGYPSARAWLAGEHDPSVEKPACAIVESRLLRATSVVTRVCIEAAAQAVHAARLDPATAATVFGSWHGEIQIAFEQIDVIRAGDGLVSPARFRNSVHNTASGVLGIATGNRGFTTAIAAGPQTFAMVLCEALAMLASGAPNVVVIVGDEPLPALLESVGEVGAMGVAIALSRERPAEPLGLLTAPRACSEALVAPPRTSPLSSTAGAVALLEALSAGRTGMLPLVCDSQTDELWAVDLEPTRTQA